MSELAERTGVVGAWFGRAGEFLVAVRSEIGKVTWPTRDELIKATRMIIILSVGLGLLIGLMDFLLNLILVDGAARLR